MKQGTKKNWEHGLVDCPSTSRPTRICKLYGGQSVTIKSIASTGKSHFIGENVHVNTKTGFELDTGETMTFGFGIEFGVENWIEIWALPETAGDDVCYAKTVNHYPSMEVNV